MKIKVIGKQHMTGTSKRTGQPYDFVSIHYNAPDRGVEGVAAKQLNLDPTLYPFANIVIGGEYEVDFNERGYCVNFRPVTKS